MTSLPEQEKVAREALRGDTVLCDGQLQRLGVSRVDRFAGQQVAVRTNVSQPTSERLVTFRALNPGTLRYASPATLAHMAGTAEIRLLLGIPPERWQAAPPGSQLLEPDARASSPDGSLLIEYDAGGYSMDTVYRKVAAFHQAGRLIWGTSSSRRGDNIEEWLRTEYPQLRVLYVPWWETPAERAHTLAGGGGSARDARKAAQLVYRE